MEHCDCYQNTNAIERADKETRSVRLVRHADRDITERRIKQTRTDSQETWSTYKSNLQARKNRQYTNEFTRF